MISKDTRKDSTSKPSKPHKDQPRVFPCLRQLGGWRSVGRGGFFPDSSEMMHRGCNKKGLRRWGRNLQKPVRQGLRPDRC